MKQNSYFRLLIAVASAYYLYICAFVISQFITQGEEVLSNPVQVLGAFGLILEGFVLIGLFRKKEWARRVILALGIILFLDSLKATTYAWLGNFFLAKLVRPRFELIPYLFNVFVKYLASAAIIYLAMAYPHKEQKTEKNRLPSS